MTRIARLYRIGVTSGERPRVPSAGVDLVRSEGGVRCETHPRLTPMRALGLLRTVERASARARTRRAKREPVDDTPINPDVVQRVRRGLRRAGIRA